MFKFFKEISFEEKVKYAKDFKKNECVLIKDILTPEAIEYFKQNMVFEDHWINDEDQFCRRMTGKDSHPYIKLFHTVTLKFMQDILGPEFHDTYAFGMEYIKGSELHPHLDLIQNEVSATLCYEANKDYPIYVDKNRTPNNERLRITNKELDRTNKFVLNIQPGDVGIFNGRNHFHWRDEAPENLSYKGVLFHFWRPRVWLTMPDHRHDGHYDQLLYFPSEKFTESNEHYTPVAGIGEGSVRGHFLGRALYPTVDKEGNPFSSYEEGWRYYFKDVKEQILGPQEDS